MAPPVLLGHLAELDRAGEPAGPIEFREVEEDGRSHQVLTGDYASWTGAWQPSELPPGLALREPRPLFVKLDETIGEDDLARP